MRLKTKQDRKDYYHGKIERLADDVWDFEEAIKWLSSPRSVKELKAKAEELEERIYALSSN